MAPQAADLAEALQKKGGLTLSQLANYDDLITDALVDRVYFWSSIRKLKANYHACRGVLEQDLCQILQENVIINRDSAAAQEKLLKLPGLAKYHKNLRTEDEKEHFVRHLRKYINIYLPDCPFEVGTTNRYTMYTAEAAIYARRYIRRGEQIRFLTGIQVEMTEKEEQELSSRTDFSIVLSSRRKRPSLFLGPARFANHDCDSNARLNTTGPHGIHIVACKEINVGDEITVTYGDDYFGEDNCECLCTTCEKLQRNGWDPRGPVLHDDSSDEDDSDDAEDDESRAPRSTGRKAASSARGKRKRDEVEEVEETSEDHQAGDADASPKRKRGRPRKYARTTDAASEGEDMEMPDAQAARYENADGRGVRGRHQYKKAYNNAIAERDAENEAAEQRIQETKMKLRAKIFSNPDKPHPTAEWFFDRVIRVLAESYEREYECKRQNQIPVGPSHDVRDPYGQPVDASESSTHDDEERSESRDRSYQSATTSMPGNVAMSGSVKRYFSQTKPASDMATSKLPSIKKSRLSGLRNVVAMDHETESDIYSIKPSPAPQPEMVIETKAAPSSRKRGRPRKYPLPEESEETSSPSPLGTKDSSAPSSGSSATSLETTHRGNISKDICDMFVRGDDEDESSAEDATPPTRQTRSSLARTASVTQTRVRDKSQSRTPAKEKATQAPRLKRTRSTMDAPTTPAVRSIEKPEPRDEAEDEDEEDCKRGPPRTPRDYHLCRALLPTPYHRWVECRNCDEFFVQDDAYLTRIACPRCERHSKLYGYYWPKTEKVGKHDREERVLDHRTIHRFIDPEEERSQRKGRKTVADLLRERETADRSESESEERSERKFRPGPRWSESQRKSTRVTM